MKKLLILPLIFLLLLSFGYADDAIFENNLAKLTVSPATSQSPTNKHNQKFTLEYKGNTNIPNGLRALYIFETKIDNSKSKILKWKEPVYEWVLQSKDFDMQIYDWNYSEQEGKNPYFVTVFKDANSVWKHDVLSSENMGNDIRRFYWEEYEITSGNKWLNVKTKWHYLGEYEHEYGNFWYYSDDFGLNVGQEITWDLDYYTSTKSGKWTLAFVQGNYNCLLTDTCTKQWVLDPWWTSPWNAKYELENFTTTRDLNVGDLIRVYGLDFSSMDITCSDMNDIRIINEDTNTQLTRHIEGTTTSTDGNIFFNLETDLDAGTYDNNFYIYTDNDNCPAPPLDYNSGIDTFPDQNILSPFWVKDGSVGGLTFADINADYYYSSPYSLRIKNDRVAGAFGVSRDGYGYDLNPFETWFYASSGQGANYCIYTIAGTAGTQGIRFDFTDDKIKYQAVGGGLTDLNASAHALDAWYKLVMDYNNNGTDISFYAYDSEDTLIGSAQNIASTIVDVNKTALSCGNGVMGFFDDSEYGMDIEDVSFSLGNKEISEGVEVHFDYDVNSITATDKILYNFTDRTIFNNSFATQYVWDKNGVQFSTDANTTESFEFGDYNICLDVNATDSDSNLFFGTTCQILSVTGGHIRIQFVDENTSVALTNVTATFNSSDYDTNTDGFIDIPLAGLTIGTYTLTASDATHSARTFTFDLNQLSVIDENVVLLKTTKGSDIEFKFYGDDETTILGDANISIKNATADKYAYIKAKTDSFGKATFFLNAEDHAYSFEIEDNTGDYNYVSGIIAVKRPKNIIDLNIITPFNITRDGIIGDFINSLSADINFNVFTNLVTPYGFLIDANSNPFYITSGSFSLIGDENFLEYQPYLVPTDADDGLEISIYTIDNQNNRKSLPGVLIELYTSISGVDTLVASKTSDGTGKAVMHFATNRPYTLKAYYEGKEKLSIVIENPANNLFLYIETGTFEDFEAQELVQVIWYYNTANLIPTNNIINMLQTIVPIATTIGDVNITISQSGSIFDTNGFTLNTSVDTNISYDVNIAGLNQYLPLVVKISIYNTSGDLLLETSGNYSFVDDSTWTDTVDNLRKGFGLLATTLILIILCTYLIALIMPGRIGQDNNWLFILPMIILGLGAFLGLIDMIAWFLASLFGISLAIWRVRE